MADNMVVEGLPEVVQALHHTAEGIEDMDAPLQLIGDRGAELAATYAPKRTLRLARSFRATRTADTATFGTDTPYAVPVNYGSRHMRPTLFVQRAQNDLEPYATAQVDNHVGTIIRERF